LLGAGSASERSLTTDVRDVSRRLDVESVLNVNWEKKSRRYLAGRNHVD